MDGVAAEGDVPLGCGNRFVGVACGEGEQVASPVLDDGDGDALLVGACGNRQCRWTGRTGRLSR
jgi:hypothetical protein